MFKWYKCIDTSISMAKLYIYIIYRKFIRPENFLAKYPIFGPACLPSPLEFQPPPGGFRNRIHRWKSLRFRGWRVGVGTGAVELQSSAKSDYDAFFPSLEGGEPSGNVNYETQQNSFTALITCFFPTCWPSFEGYHQQAFGWCDDPKVTSPQTPGLWYMDSFVTIVFPSHMAKVTHSAHLHVCWNKVHQQIHPKK